VQIAAVEQCLHKHRHAANVVQMIAFATRGCPQVMAENGVCHVVG